MEISSFCFWNCVALQVGSYYYLYFSVCPKNRRKLEFAQVITVNVSEQNSRIIFSTSSKNILENLQMNMKMLYFCILPTPLIFFRTIRGVGKGSKNGRGDSISGLSFFKTLNSHLHLNTRSGGQTMGGIATRTLLYEKISDYGFINLNGAVVQFNTLQRFIDNNGNDLSFRCSLLDRQQFRSSYIT